MLGRSRSMLRRFCHHSHQDAFMPWPALPDRTQPHTWPHMVTSSHTVAHLISQLVTPGHTLSHLMGPFPCTCLVTPGHTLLYSGPGCGGAKPDCPAGGEARSQHAGQAPRPECGSHLVSPGRGRAGGPWVWGGLGARGPCHSIPSPLCGRGCNADWQPSMHSSGYLPPSLSMDHGPP